MGFFKRLIDGFRGYSSSLDTYEMAIVEAVAATPDADSAAKLRRRARAINRVQRLMGGEDTTLYQMRGGRPVFPHETAIIDAPDSVRFARVMVRSSEPTSRLKAMVFLHDGILSSIDFGRPTKFADAAKIDEIAVEILGPPFRDPDAQEEGTGWPDR